MLLIVERVSFQQYITVRSTLKRVEYRDETHIFMPF